MTLNGGLVERGEGLVGDAVAEEIGATPVGLELELVPESSRADGEAAGLIPKHAAELESDDAGTEVGTRVGTEGAESDNVRDNDAELDIEQLDTGGAAAL